MKKESSEHIIDETATIEGADIENVYNECVEWLKEINAVIEEVIKPLTIKARQEKSGNPRWGWLHTQDMIIWNFPSTDVLDMKKNITIILEKQENDVLLRIRIDPWSRINGLDSFQNRRSIWLKFVGDIIQRLGVELDRTRLQYYYSSEWYTD